MASVSSDRVFQASAGSPQASAKRAFDMRAAEDGLAIGEPRRKRGAIVLALTGLRALALEEGGDIRVGYIGALDREEMRKARQDDQLGSGDAIAEVL